LNENFLISGKIKNKKIKKCSMKSEVTQLSVTLQIGLHLIQKNAKINYHKKKNIEIDVLFYMVFLNLYSKRNLLASAASFLIVYVAGFVL
jgi:hypothetical protein